ELEKEIGGLCRSFTLGGGTFDLGGHAFFTKHTDLLALFEAKVKGGFFAQPRPADVSSHGIWVRYPFQAHLFGLPQDVGDECLARLDEIETLQIDQSNLEGWILAAFGPGIAKHFMRPYNQKVWAWPLEEIRTDWASGRIVKPDVKSITEGATGSRAYTNFENALVRYPNIGGFSSIYRPFAPPAPSIMLQSEVIKVEINTKTVHLASGETLPFSAIVSTMPLNVLAEITCDITEEMRNAARLLRWNSLHLANFAVEGAQQTDRHRIYSANLDIPFHKLVINSISSPTLRNEPLLGLQAEISFSRQKHVTREGLLERCWSAVEEMGLLGPNAQATHSELRTIERAYPIATRQSKGAPEFLIEKFAQLGVFCAGRFGMWRYVNSDDAFHLGRQAIVKAQDFCRN